MSYALSPFLWRFAPSDIVRMRCGSLCEVPVRTIPLKYLVKRMTLSQGHSRMSQERNATLMTHMPSFSRHAGAGRQRKLVPAVHLAGDGPGAQPVPLRLVSATHTAVCWVIENYDTAMTVWWQCDSRMPPQTPSWPSIGRLLVCPFLLRTQPGG
jgi:hypothetical protein